MDKDFVKDESKLTLGCSWKSAGDPCNWDAAEAEEGGEAAD